MDNQVAIVTGAAGGIGAAVAAALCRRGTAVAAVDRDAARLREVVAKLTTDGGRVEAFPTDVTSSTQVESTVDAIESRLGPVEYLVNAAGVMRVGEARHVTDADLAATMAVNVAGVCYMSRAAVNRMVPRRRGAVVTVASNAAAVPRFSMAAYAASKAAASMYTRCLGLEVARYGIRCNVVAPGSTDTSMLRETWQDDSGLRSTLEGRLDTFRVGVPLNRIAAPADVADAVVFLLSEQARHVTMHSLTVDGGAALSV